MKVSACYVADNIYNIGDSEYGLRLVTLRFANDETLKQYGLDSDVVASKIADVISAMLNDTEHKQTECTCYTCKLT